MKKRVPKRAHVRGVFIVSGILFICCGLVLSLISRLETRNSMQKVSVPDIFTVESSENKWNVGDEYAVTISLHPGDQPVTETVIELLFDPEAVKIIRSDPSAAFSTNMETSQMSYGKMTLHFGPGKKKDAVTGENTVVAVTVRALRPRATTQISLSPHSYVSFVNSEKKYVNKSYESTSLNVIIE